MRNNSGLTVENRAFHISWDTLFPELYPGTVQFRPASGPFCFLIVLTIHGLLSFFIFPNTRKRKAAGIVYTIQFGVSLK